MTVRPLHRAARAVLLVCCLLGMAGGLGGCSPSSEAPREPAATPRASQEALDSIRAYRDGAIRKSRLTHELGEERTRAIDGALRQ